MLLYISILLLLSASGSTGTSHANPRIVGGNETTIEEHPWQISFQLLGSHTCGGSIISPDTVLTAAHCVNVLLLQIYEVVAGTTNLLNEGIRARLYSIIVHENYNYNNDYDVAILKLAENLTFTEKIQPVALAEHELPPGTPVVVSGWGSEDELNTTTPDVLRAVEVNIVNRDTCTADYANIEGGEITDRMICAGVRNGGKDACSADSGGPLTKDGVLHGVVSWGVGCGRPQYPGVYANVPNLLEWIKEKSGI